MIRPTASKSCSLDPLPSQLVVNNLDVLMPIICRIVNLSLENSQVPSALKVAVLQPLLKKPSLDHEIFKNFRPVSNLKMTSKTTEKVVAVRLNHYLEENNLCEPLQSAYKKYHSCETALLRVENDILCALDDNKYVVLLMLDLSAAFDTVDHDILLYRMQSKFGITGKALDWFRSYLTDRTQFVNIKGVKSDIHNVTCGVPQGSVLGPILYLLYTSPLGDILRNHNMSFHLYADDSQLYTTFSLNSDIEQDSATSRIEVCIVDIESWMNQNKLKLNGDKTELIIFYPKHRQPPKNSIVSVGSDQIEPAASIRNFGVIFDNTMSMVPHVNSVCKSAFYHLRNIARIRKFLTSKSAETLVHAFVSSKIDYCNSLLYGIPKYILQKLQYVQNAAARLITLSRKHDHITPHLMHLHWLPVEYRVHFKILLLTYKVLNGQAPRYLLDLLQHYTPKRNLRSSSACLLQQKRFRLSTYGSRAFSVTAPLLWNKLPLSIKKSSNLTQFKTSVKPIYLSLLFLILCFIIEYDFF